MTDRVGTGKIKPSKFIPEALAAKPAKQPADAIEALTPEHPHKETKAQVLAPDNNHSW